LKVAIIGCGLMGEKRARHLCGARLVSCADIDSLQSARVASLHPGCTPVSDWRPLLNRDLIDAILICTPPGLHAQIMRGAIHAGIHVLVEKPAGLHAAELRDLPRLAKDAGVRIRVGFNLRHHRAFRQARAMVDSGALGSLMFLRARYGHGGRAGYEGEWRAQPKLSGGGELIDQGVHIIDLARWFLGEFAEVDGFCHTYFWNMPVEDNGFMMLKTAARQVAFMHASCTEWKNTFSWELYGNAGKLQVDGLGGSYGEEKLSWHKIRAESGPPDTTVWEFAAPDDSWDIEMAEFMEDIRASRDPSPGLADAIAALQIVDKLYQRSGHDHHA
jgi:predicted dehydrogenase